MARRTRRLSIIMTAVLMAAVPGGSAPAAAQGETVVPASELEEICRKNAPNRNRRQACLSIVRTILAPAGSLVIPAAEPPVDADDGATAGASLETDHLVMRMAEFAWDAQAGFRPDDGFRWVAARFEVESKDPDAYVAVPSFTATDESGFSYGFSTAVDPSLENGRLQDGQKRMGWVAFQVPETATQLVIEYFPFVSDSQETLVWTVVNPSS